MRAFPSPTAREPVGFSVAAGDAQITIYDVEGQLIWRAAVQATDEPVIWHLQDGGGSPVASGVYLYRIQSGESSHEGSIVVAR